MTDFTHDWIAKREQLEGAATEGPWATYEAYEHLGVGIEDDEESLFIETYGVTYATHSPDAEFIADARISLPAAVAALKAVLAIEPMPNHLDMQPRDRDYADGHNDALRLVANTITDVLRGES